MQLEYHARSPRCLRMPACCTQTTRVHRWVCTQIVCMGGLPESSVHACSPDDPMAQPPHGTEVFLGGVPRTATEEQLAGFAGEVGEVHSVALLKDPQNGEQNRGCAGNAPQWHRCIARSHCSPCGTLAACIWRNTLPGHRARSLLAWRMGRPWGWVMKHMTHPIAHGP